MEGKYAKKFLRKKAHRMEQIGDGIISKIRGRNGAAARPLLVYMYVRHRTSTIIDNETADSHSPISPSRSHEATRRWGRTPCYSLEWGPLAPPARQGKRACCTCTTPRAGKVYVLSAGLDGDRITPRCKASYSGTKEKLLLRRPPLARSLAHERGEKE